MFMVRKIFFEFFFIVFKLLNLVIYTLFGVNISFYIIVGVGVIDWTGTFFFGIFFIFYLIFCLLELLFVVLDVTYSLFYWDKVWTVYPDVYELRSVTLLNHVS